MSTLTQEIEQAIKNNLPSVVGDQLRLRLSQADTAELNFKNAQASVANLQARLDAALAQNIQQKLLADREAAVAKRETDVLAREVRQDLQKLAVELADKRAVDALALAHGVFANAKFKYEETKEVPLVRQYFNNGVPSSDYVAPSVSTERGTREG